LKNRQYDYYVIKKALYEFVLMNLEKKHGRCLTAYHHFSLNYEEIQRYNPETIRMACLAYGPVQVSAITDLT